MYLDQRNELFQVNPMRYIWYTNLTYKTSSEQIAIASDYFQWLNYLPSFFSILHEVSEFQINVPIFYKKICKTIGNSKTKQETKNKGIKAIANFNKFN